MTTDIAPTRRRVAAALAPAGVYLAVRLVGVVVLGWMAGGRELVDVLSSWDGNWLLAIAQYGYANVPTDHLDAFGRHSPVTPLGFFPVSYTHLTLPTILRV